MEFKFLIAAAVCSLALAQFAQAETIPKEELMFLTSEWRGERFPDCRPKVPDDLIKRVKEIAM